VVTDVRLDAARETAALIQESGGIAVAWRLDVADRASVQGAVNEVRAEFGRIDILVNNAGWDKVEPFLESDESTWDRIVAINLYGVLHMCKAVLPGMIEQGYGRVVNIGSDAGRVGSSGEAVYSAAKGGVIAFTKTLAREMAQHKITVNCVSPGPANTPLLAGIAAENPKLVTALERAIPLRRLAEPEDIANAVAFLASDDAAYITGQTLSVSGGLTMA
jgi:2-hydroxycyclohexanecarboxyl-CoA dehydrogenase